MFCFLYRAWLYMSNTESVLKERELLTLRVHLSSLTGFNWVFPRAPEFTNGFGWVFLRAPEFTHWFWLAFRSCTWVHPLVLVGSFFVIFLVFCVVIYFCVLLVSVLCLVCPVLPVSRIVQAWLPLQFSLTFISKCIATTCLWSPEPTEHWLWYGKR
jgi:hypothetical protein